MYNIVETYARQGTTLLDFCFKNEPLTDSPEMLSFGIANKSTFIHQWKYTLACSNMQTNDTLKHHYLIT